jgi:8-oxo-dGTP pyrophosphatase MutT (NUDIX family)
VEFSFGIVPLRKKGQEILLIHSRKGHWTLPKGHADPGETPWETAERELTEETGLVVLEFLSVPPCSESYLHNDIEKVATYFPALVEGEISLLLEEVQGAAWYDHKTALQKLTFAETRAACQRAIKYLRHV